MPKITPEFQLPANLNGHVVLLHEIHFREGKKAGDKWTVSLIEAPFIKSGPSVKRLLKEAGKAWGEHLIESAKPTRKLTEEEIQRAVEREFAGVENPSPEELASHRWMLETYYRVAV